MTAVRLPRAILLALLVGGATFLSGFPAAVAQAPSLPLIEPDAGRQPVLDFIDSAQATLDLAIYELTDSRVVGALESDAGRGVQVRVLAEPMPGGRPVNARALAELQSRGVVVRDSAPWFRLTHEKTVVVDDSSALIMSLNLVPETFSDTRDVAVVDSDPSDVDEIEAVFQADWDRRPIDPEQADLVWSPDNARARIESTLTSAVQEIDIYAEELLDRDILQTLETEAAAGVRVRLIMTDTGSRDSSRADRMLLSSEGGQVRLLQKPYVHAKVILIDGTLAFLGSENLSEESLDANRELGLLTSDPSVVGSLSDTFEQDWQRASP